MKLPKIHKFPKALVKKKRKYSKRTKKFDGRAEIDKVNRTQLTAFDMVQKKHSNAKMPYSEEILEKNSYKGDRENKYWRKDYEKQT